MCRGCGIILEDVDGPVDPYGVSTSACWAFYTNNILTRDFSGEEYFASHRITVDAYMAQHPSRVSRASVQSVWVHLAGLYLLIIKKASPKFIGRFMQIATEKKIRHPWLDPPEKFTLNARHLTGATEPGEYFKLAFEWGNAVWNDWEAHHKAIVDFSEAVLKKLG